MEEAHSSLIDEKYERAEELYSQIIESSCKDIKMDDVYSKRASARLSLNKYEEALEDAVCSIQLNSKRAIAYFRKAVACFHLEEFESAKTSYQIALDFADATTDQSIIKQSRTGIRKCDVEIQEEEPVAVPAVKKLTAIRHEWYQSPTHVTVSIFQKNMNQDTVQVQMETKRLSVFVVVNGESKSALDISLQEEIDPEASEQRITATKIELKLKKKALVDSMGWIGIQDQSAKSVDEY